MTDLIDDTCGVSVGKIHPRQSAYFLLSHHFDGDTPGALDVLLKFSVVGDEVGEPVVIDDDRVILVVVKAELGVMADAVVELVGEVVVDNVVLVWIN